MSTAPYHYQSLVPIGESIMNANTKTNRCLARRFATLTLTFGLAGAVLVLGSNKLPAHPPSLGHVAVAHPAHPSTPVHAAPAHPVHPAATPKGEHMAQGKPTTATQKGGSKPVGPPVQAGHKAGDLAGHKPVVEHPPLPVKPPSTRPGGMPGNPGGASSKPGGSIVQREPQIGRIKEWEHHRRHWDHWHPPTTDYGSGNTFSATNTYSPTIENSGNTNTETVKTVAPSDSETPKSPSKTVAKDRKNDDSEATNGKENNDNNDSVLDEADELFKSARAAFKQGDYDKAVEQVSAAIEKRPNTAALHEFKALCYFAQRKYKEAAPLLYAVISSGPGWDVDTLKKFYPNQDTYVRHLEALKSFVGQEPDKAYGHFVLAYHYLTRGSTMLAKKQLQEVVRTQPDDKLSAAMLKVL
jgi:hypothetical protein